MQHESSSDTPPVSETGRVFPPESTSPSIVLNPDKLLAGARSVHFVGIGGIGMSGMARVLLQMGYTVTGSDLKRTNISESLCALGAKVFIGHDKGNVDGAELVVFSSAVPPDNVELRAANAQHIPVLHRSQMLAALMHRQRAIAVAGSHGKSTTTSMLSFILERAGYDPTVIIGGELDDIGGNAKLGQGDFLVAEADESDGSLLNLDPEHGVITNVDLDHVDYFETEERLIATFREFLLRIPHNGIAVVCGDCPNVQHVLSARTHATVLTYGFGDGLNYRARHCHLSPEGASFDVTHHDKTLSRLQLCVPGKHNVLNAVAAFVMAESIGVPTIVTAEILPHYKGIKRRWETIADVSGIWIVDDYAHHPTEVKATLSAAKSSYSRRLIVAFQPHRYTRTRYLSEQFGAAFTDADHVLVSDVYAALEEPIAGVSGHMIVDCVRRLDPRRSVEYIPRIEDVEQRLAELARPGDIVITMGAGDIYRIAQSLARRLAECPA